MAPALDTGMQCKIVIGNETTRCPRDGGERGHCDACGERAHQAMMDILRRYGWHDVAYDYEKLHKERLNK
jgi:hypothetical protein